MREILFRSKRVDNGEWVEGYLVKCDERFFILPATRVLCWHFDFLKKGEYLFGKFVEVIPETIGQYTGITDKNGKKIFEGDIVRERGGESYQGYYEIDNVLTVKIPDTLVNFEMSYDCEYKIIGNIYDNPERLKRSDNNGRA